MPPDNAEPKPLPPSALPNPLVPEDRPANGELPAVLPKVNLGALAGWVVDGAAGEAKELRVGLPAVAEAKTLP